MNNRSQHSTREEKMKTHNFRAFKEKCDPHLTITAQIIADADGIDYRELVIQV